MAVLSLPSQLAHIIFILNPIQIPGNMCMCSSSHILKTDKELKKLLNDSN